MIERIHTDDEEHQTMCDLFKLDFRDLHMMVVAMVMIV